MADEQQSGSSTEIPETGNVMDRVLATFDGLFDNTTGKLSEFGSTLGEKAGDLTGSIGDNAGSIGEKAGEAAGSIGTTLGENLDAAVTFAKGLFGG